MSNRKKLPKPKNRVRVPPDRYAWLKMVRADPRLSATDKIVAEAAAFAADDTGRVTETDLFNALAILGHPVTDRSDLQ